MGLFNRNKMDNTVGEKIVSNPMYKKIKADLNTIGYDIMSAFIDDQGFVQIAVYPYGTKDHPTIEVVNNKVVISTVGNTQLDPEEFKVLTQNYANGWKVARYLQKKIDDKSIFELARV